jgi:hypothetical protein
MITKALIGRSWGMTDALIWRSIDDPSKEVAFTDFSFVPLSYQDFRKVKFGKPATLPLRISGALISGSAVPETSGGRFDAASPSFDQVLEVDAGCLVAGGWLPPGLINAEVVNCLLDRNAIGHLLGHAKNPKIAKNAFSSLLNYSNFQLNPLAHVIERANTKQESGADLIASLERDCDRLQAAFPQARYTPFSNVSPDRLVEIAAEARAQMNQDEAYLRRAVPLISSPSPRAQISNRASQLLEIADNLRLDTGNLVFLATMSCLLMKNRDCPATRIIKPEKHYSEEKLRNSLSDFLMLKLLTVLIAKAPKGHVVTCVTRDRGMIGFWSSLRPTFTEGSLEVRLLVDDEMFPGLDDTPAGKVILP